MQWGLDPPCVDPYMAWGPQYGIKLNPAVPGGALDVQGVLFEARMQQGSTSSVKRGAVCAALTAALEGTLIHGKDPVTPQGAV